MFMAALEIAKDLGEQVSQDAIELALLDLNSRLNLDDGSLAQDIPEEGNFPAQGEPYPLPSTNTPDLENSVTDRAGKEHYAEVQATLQEKAADQARTLAGLPDPYLEAGVQPPFLKVEDVDRYRQIATDQAGTFPNHGDQ